MYFHVTLEEKEVKILLTTVEDSSVLDSYIFYLSLMNCYTCFSKPNNNSGFLYVLDFIQIISDASLHSKLGKPRHRWEDNIKLDQEVGWGKWTGLIRLRIGTGGVLLRMQ
jgi:hypothetical protein